MKLGSPAATALAAVALGLAGAPSAAAQDSTTASCTGGRSCRPTRPRPRRGPASRTPRRPPPRRDAAGRRVLRAAARGRRGVLGHARQRLRLEGELGELHPSRLQGPAGLRDRGRRDAGRSRSRMSSSCAIRTATCRGRHPRRGRRSGCSPARTSTRSRCGSAAAASCGSATSSAPSCCTPTATGRLLEPPVPAALCRLARQPARPAGLRRPTSPAATASRAGAVDRPAHAPPGARGPHHHRSRPAAPLDVRVRRAPRPLPPCRRQYRVEQAGNLVADATALDRDRVVVLERDNGEGPAAAFKKVFVVDLGGWRQRVPGEGGGRRPAGRARPGRSSRCPGGRGTSAWATRSRCPTPTIESVLPLATGASPSSTTRTSARAGATRTCPTTATSSSSTSRRWRAARCAARRGAARRPAAGHVREPRPAR